MLLEPKTKPYWPIVLKGKLIIRNKISNVDHVVKKMTPNNNQQINGYSKLDNWNTRPDITSWESRSTGNHAKICNLNIWPHGICQTYNKFQRLWPIKLFGILRNRRSSNPNQKAEPSVYSQRKRKEQ